MNGRSGRGSSSREGGPHPSQTPANIVALAQVSSCLGTGADLPDSLYRRWFDAGSNPGTGAEHQQGKQEQGHPAGLHMGLPWCHHDHPQTTGCSLGNGINSYLRYAKKHFHTNMPETLIANTAFHTHLLTSLLSNSTPLPPPNNSLATHQCPFTCKVLSRSLSASSWDNPGHATGAFHAVHNP